jgi:hypothetical protein
MPQIGQSQATPTAHAEARVRRLSTEEVRALRKDMIAASAWMKAELSRRRVANGAPT